MIIDIHSHADFYGHSVEKVLENKNKFGIDITVLTSCETPTIESVPSVQHMMSPFTDVDVPFERCVAYKEKAPDRFLLAYAPDPRKPDAISKLKAVLNLYDICMCGEVKFRMMYDNFDAIRLFRFCGENGLPVLMHFEYDLNEGTYPWPGYWFGGGIDTLERVLKQCPETVFIGHAMGLWLHISGDEQYKTTKYPTGPVLPGGQLIKLLDMYPNLYCDISAHSGFNALSRDVEFARKFLIQWQDRIVYGRDNYENGHREFLESEKLALPADVLRKLYCGNARRILRNGDKIKNAPIV